MAGKFFRTKNEYKYNSTDIKMYPCAERLDSADRNAKLFTERNITSIVNRLTSVPCFVIDGVSITHAGSKIQVGAGKVNIFGYLFDLQQPISLNAGDFTNYKYLYLTLCVHGANTYNSPFRLAQYDGNVIEDVGSQKFHGLSFAATENYIGYELERTASYICYGVCIAKKVDDTWQSYYANDGAGAKLGDASFVNGLSSLKYNIEDIKVNDADNELTPTANDFSQVIRDRAQDTNTYSKNRQNLKTYLDYNYILDDGEL